MCQFRIENVNCINCNDERKKKQIERKAQKEKHEQKTIIIKSSITQFDWRSVVPYFCKFSPKKKLKYHLAKKITANLYKKKLQFCKIKLYKFNLNGLILH